MQHIYHLIFFLVFVIFAACESTVDDAIPAYIQIDDITLSNEDAIGISDAWVWVNDNILGVYELPMEFPVLAEGTTKITIRPGVKVNGMQETRTYYPFYTPYIIDIDLTAGKTTNISPRSQYESWANKISIENFEGATKNFERFEPSDTIIEFSTNKAFEGKYSGAVFLDKERNNFAAITEESFVIPNFEGSNGMFLEMNYKTDMELEVGVYVNKTESIIYLLPSKQWKKIYIDLYSTLSNYTSGYAFKVYLAASLPNNLSGGTIFIDDLKLAY